MTRTIKLKPNRFDICCEIFTAAQVGKTYDDSPIYDIRKEDGDSIGKIERYEHGWQVLYEGTRIRRSYCTEYRFRPAGTKEYGVSKLRDAAILLLAKVEAEPCQ